MKKGYLGLEGCLQHLLDISEDYDGCGDNVKELKELIDEIRKYAEFGLKYKKDFYVPLYSAEEVKEMLKNKSN